MRKRILAVSIITFLLCAVSALASDQKPITAGVFISEPWGFFDDGGQPAGLGYDILKTVALELGRPLDVRIIPFARLMKELESGKVDVTFLFRSPNAERVAVAVAPIHFDFNTVILPRPGFELKSMEDLVGRKVAWVLGARLGKVFDENTVISKTSVKDYETAMRVLKGSRVDAVAGSEPSIVWNAKKLKMEAGRHFGEALVIDSKRGWVQLSKQTVANENLDAWVAAVDRVHKSGVISEILNHYGYNNSITK